MTVQAFEQKLDKIEAPFKKAYPDAAQRLVALEKEIKPPVTTNVQYIMAVHNRIIETKQVRPARVCRLKA